MQGATNELSPANAAIAKVTSDMRHEYSFFILRLIPNSFPIHPIRFYLGIHRFFSMNKRFIVVGIALAALVIIAVYAGSPMFGGFDQLR
jgi:hypothetical protein